MAGIAWRYSNKIPAVGRLLKVAADELKTTLFKPLKVGSLTLKNRIIVSPMCQYSCKDGYFNDWHLQHLGRFAVGGAGLVIFEMTAVQANGRISPYCSGLWEDGQIAPLKKVVDFVHSQEAHAALQLAHAGRKASTLPPFLFEGQKWVATKEQNGWPDNVKGPSAVAFSKDYAEPSAMTVDEIKQLVQDFATAAARAVKADFDMVEIHGAHGYLVNQFLSPRSNKRNDEYGGSFENRCRLLLEIVKALRAKDSWGTRPLAVRLSCIEWVDDGWQMEDTLKLVEKLVEAGVDLVDCSTGGNSIDQKIKVGPGYQVPYAAEVKKKFDGKIVVTTVGEITEPKQAEEILANGSADAVALARQFLREPQWPLRAASELGVPIAWPPQYARAAKF